MSTEANSSVETIRSQLAADVESLLTSMRRIYRLRSFLISAAVIFGSFFVLAGLDWIMQREELGLRILFFLVWIVCVAIAAYYLIVPAWRFAPSKVEVARWIERVQPELGERLSTAVQLVDAHHDERLGSAQFRGAAIRNWADYASQVDWRSYLDHSSWLRAGGVFAVLIVLGGVIAAWRPTDTGLAIARFFAPWAKLPWPQRDQLRFVNLPKVIASGHELNLEIIDAVPPLPEVVELLVRYPDSETPKDVAPYPTKNLTDVSVASIASVDQAIEIRAVGGDDRSMAWQRVDVAQPPKLESYRFRVEPPAYSGRAASEVVGNRIQVLVGSRVAFVGRVAESVTAIEAVLQQKLGSGTDQAGDDSDNTRNRSATIASNQHDFEWNVCDASTPVGSQVWRWKIKTLAEFAIETPEVWSVEVIPDATPVVTLADQELAQLSPDATLVLRGSAVDDLGLQDVALRWQIEAAEATEPGRLELWAASKDANTSVVGSTDARREFSVDRTWQIDSSVSLLAGQQLTLWMEARDTLGQLGKSITQTLEVRSAEDILESIAARQSQLLEQVRTITDAQRRNSQLAARSREILEQASTVRREDADALANVSQMQQSVNRQLNAEQNSVSESLRTLTTLLQNNQLADSDMANQVAELTARIDAIAKKQLADALRNAQVATEQAKQLAGSAPSPPTPALKTALAESDASQNAALAELQSLTDRLAQSESLRSVERELSQVLNQQQSLRRDTDSLELRRLAGMKKEDFQASRTGLQSDQQGLAQAVDQLQKRAKTLAESMPADQAEMRVRVQHAMEELTRAQVSGEMRAASESIANDRFVDATKQQAAVLESLRNVLQDLGSSAARNLEGKLGQLKSSTAELQQLASDQRDLAEQMAAPNSPSQAAALSAKQKSIQSETERQRSQSSSAGDNQTAESLDSALKSQASAAQSAAQGQTSQASKLAENAAEQLAKAAKDSAQRAKELEREVAEQQLMQLGAALKQLAEQQAPLVEKLTEAAQVQLDVLDGEERETAEKGLRQLASRQESIRQMVRDVRLRADKLPAFDWTLEQAELDMARAVAAAQRFRIAPDATDAAKRALRKLEQASEAMKSRQQEPQAANQQQNESEQADKDKDNKTRPVPPIASLKLLRGLQADVNDETKQLNQASDIIESERKQRLEQLSQQQQSLGLQLEQILRELAATDEQK